MAKTRMITPSLLREKLRPSASRRGKLPLSRWRKGKPKIAAYSAGYWSPSLRGGLSSTSLAKRPGSR
eukprot:9017714-Alexandrium_andersonii.AAC.1